MAEIPETRASLLIRLRDPANRDAWGEFASLYEPLIYRLARRRGLQHADAQDLTQDVMAAISKSIQRLDVSSDRGRFRGWLFRIARNLIINLETRGRRCVGTGDTAIQELLEQEFAISPEEQRAFVLEYRRQVFQWAANSIRTEFHDHTWGAFWQTTVEGREIPLVARQLGLSVGSVYAARSRVLARLRNQVERIEEFDSTIGEISDESCDRFGLAAVKHLDANDARAQL